MPYLPLLHHRPPDLVPVALHLPVLNLHFCLAQNLHLQNHHHPLPWSRSRLSRGKMTCKHSSDRHGCPYYDDCSAQAARIHGLSQVRCLQSILIHDTWDIPILQCAHQPGYTWISCRISKDASSQGEKYVQATLYCLSSPSNSELSDTGSTLCLQHPSKHNLL